MTTSWTFLTAQQVAALREMIQLEGSRNAYWRRRASCKQLAVLGFAEPYTPDFLALRQGKEKPYRATAAGRAALSVQLPAITQSDEIARLTAESAAKDRRIAELEGALKPFADAAHHLHPALPDDGVTLDAIEVRQWRQAASVSAALTQPKGDDK